MKYFADSVTYYNGSEFIYIEIYSFLPPLFMFFWSVSKLYLLSLLNFQNGDNNWFLKCGVYGYFTFIFLLNENG